MNERKLTTEQIEELHEFCYFRGVFHYDVQVEIVDHLATAIENLWTTNPDLPFDEAMYLVGEQFGGDLGFDTIKKEKEKALRKQYRRLLWQFVADYYKFPKIMITTLLSLTVYSALYFSENDQYIVIPLVASFFLFSAYYSIFYRPNHVRLKAKKGYSFLLNEISMKGILYKTGIGFGGAAISMASHPQSHFTTFGSLLFSTIVSLYLVLLYGDCFYIPKKIREHFEEQFPQFVII